MNKLNNFENNNQHIAFKSVFKSINLIEIIIYTCSKIIL